MLGIDRYQVTRSMYYGSLFLRKLIDRDRLIERMISLTNDQAVFNATVGNINQCGINPNRHPWEEMNYLENLIILWFNMRIESGMIRKVLNEYRMDNLKLLDDRNSTMRGENSLIRICEEVENGSFSELLKRRRENPNTMLRDLSESEFIEYRDNVRNLIEYLRFLKLKYDNDPNIWVHLSPICEHIIRADPRPDLAEEYLHKLLESWFQMFHTKEAISDTKGGTWGSWRKKFECGNARLTVIIPVMIFKFLTNNDLRNLVVQRLQDKDTGDGSSINRRYRFSEQLGVFWREFKESYVDYVTRDR